jgi:hypothetical protein
MGWSIENYVYRIACHSTPDLPPLLYSIFLYTRSVYPVTGIALHFGCFHVRVSSVALAANSVYRESGSMGFGSMYSI